MFDNNNNNIKQHQTAISASKNQQYKKAKKKIMQKETNTQIVNEIVERIRKNAHLNAIIQFIYVYIKHIVHILPQQYINHITSASHRLKNMLHFFVYRSTKPKSWFFSARTHTHTPCYCLLECFWFRETHPFHRTWPWTII